MSVSTGTGTVQKSAAIGWFKFCLLASVVLPAVAVAQSAPPASGAASSAPASTSPAAAPVELQEVVVTAERRSEKLSKVPIDVSSFRASDLANTGINNAIQLTDLVPTLVQVKGPSADAYENPFIRGVGSSSTAPGDDASVATYIDGVYQPDKTANLFEMNDIDHIEVLKGPQGTLFGRNATGGAISVITKTPSDTPEFDTEVSYASLATTVDKAYLTGPITDTLAGSLSWHYKSGGNFITDLHEGGHLGGSQGTALTGELLWKPLDNLKIRFEVIDNNQIAHPAGTAIAVVPGTKPVGALFFGGAYSDNINYYRGEFDSYVRQKNIQPQLHIDYSLDGFDITSTTAYMHASNATPLDYDSTTASVFYFINQAQKTRSWSEELQFKSNDDGPFQWVGGLYYANDVQGQEPVYYVSGAAYPAAPADFLAPSCTRLGAAGCNVAGFNAVANDLAVAAFGEASYAITPDDKITIGLRYSQERKKLQGETQAFFAEPGPNENVGLNTAYPPPGFVGITPGSQGYIVNTADAHTIYRKPTWRFAYNHDFDNDVHAYFSYNRGFKSGAYNLASLTQPPVAPEVIDAYEVGLKSTWFGRRLQLNPSVYYYDYSNLQVQKVNGGDVTIQNAGAAKLYGLDMDWAILATDQLKFHGSLSVEHTEYQPYADASSFGFAPGVGQDFGVATTVNATGQSLIYAPIYAFNIGATYNYEFPDSSTLVADTNYSYSGKYNQVAGAQGNEIYPHSDMTASLTFTPADARFYGRVFGYNLTNVRVIGTQLNSVGYFQEFQAPRVIGVALGMKLSDF